MNCRLWIPQFRISSLCVIPFNIDPTLFPLLLILGAFLHPPKQMSVIYRSNEYVDPEIVQYSVFDYSKIVNRMPAESVVLLLEVYYICCYFLVIAFLTHANR